MLPKPALRRIGIPFFDMEIDVNNKNPRGEMHIVEPSAITRFRRVPELNFSFYTRMQLW
jgi:hypothetical protein